MNRSDTPDSLDGFTRENVLPKSDSCDGARSVGSPDELRIINRLSVVGIAGNVALSAFKLFAGVVGNSSAMVSDAVHSISDVMTTVIAFAGARMAKRPEDVGHPYGHERFECLAALVVGCFLLVAGLGIGWAGIENIIDGSYRQLQVPGGIALVAAVVSIAVKEAMFWYTRHWARVMNSSVFMADAWHHRSDALSSVGSFVGIGLSMLGFPIGDPLASAIISILILKVAYDVMKDAVNKVVDTPCSSEFESGVRACINRHSEVGRIDMLRTRQFGNRVFVDAEIAVDGEMTLRHSHEIAHAVHDCVEREFPEVKHIMIHVNPL